MISDWVSSVPALSNTAETAVRTDGSTTAAVALGARVTVKARSTVFSIMALTRMSAAAWRVFSMAATI